MCNQQKAVWSNTAFVINLHDAIMV